MAIDLQAVAQRNADEVYEKSRYGNDLEPKGFGGRRQRAERDFQTLIDAERTKADEQRWADVMFVAAEYGVAMEKLRK